MRFADAFRALRDLTNYETMVRPPYGTREMNLPRTRALLRAVGSPERAYPSLQVAGTKGKGTAATALAGMLGAGGFRVGLYTSPHLFDIRERIRVDGHWIGKAEFGRGVAALLPHVAPLRGTPRCPTFFELMTVLALRHFAEAKVDAAVLEVGLGGRLDATSAARPIASLVTQIGLDHVRVLGRTKAAIAAEKAGVARRGVPLLSGVPPATAAGRTIREVAEAKGAPLFAPGRDLRIRTGRPRRSRGRWETPVAVRTRWAPPLSAPVALLGRDLARDAGLAAATLMIPRVRKLLPLATDEMVRGLAGLSLKGRIQVVAESPFLVVDGAHNVDSARSLVRTLLEALPFRRAFAIVGGGEDKALAGIVTALAGLGRRTRFVFTRPAGHPRAADPEGLARKTRGAVSCANLPAALDAVRAEADPSDLVVVTGSLYLAGEALTLLA